MSQSEQRHSNPLNHFRRTTVALPMTPFIYFQSWPGICSTPLVHDREYIMKRNNYNNNIHTRLRPPTDCLMEERLMILLVGINNWHKLLLASKTVAVGRGCVGIDRENGCDAPRVVKFCLSR